MTQSNVNDWVNQIIARRRDEQQRALLATRERERERRCRQTVVLRPTLVERLFFGFNARIRRELALSEYR